MTSDPRTVLTERTAPPLRTGIESVFHLVIVASQRAKQLMAGARPRVEPGRHRAARIALLEVGAGLVSWTFVEPPQPAEPAPKPPR